MTNLTHITKEYPKILPQSDLYILNMWRIFFWNLWLQAKNLKQRDWAYYI